MLGNPNLRRQADCTATSNFFSNVAFAIILVFLVRELGLSAGVIGARPLGREPSGSLTARFHRHAHLRDGSASGRRRSPSAMLFGPAMLLVACRPDRKRGDPVPRTRRSSLFGFTVVVYNIVQTVISAPHHQPVAVFRILESVGSHRLIAAKHRRHRRLRRRLIELARHGARAWRETKRHKPR